MRRRRLLLVVGSLVVLVAVGLTAQTATVLYKEQVDTLAELNTIVGDATLQELPDEKCFHLIADIGVTEEWVIRLPPFTGTMTRFDCESFSGTSFTVDVCDGEDTGDDTCATSILGAPLACGTSGANDTTLSATGFSARDFVTVVITAQTGDPRGDFYMTCTVD